MRVTTGRAKGRNLITVPGDSVRPTPSKVKEAVFSSIQFSLNGSFVLDLFAGCGQMGIEAISRGAEKATFCDTSKASLDVISRNIENCGFLKECSVLKTDAVTFVKTTSDKFNFIFLDPPYHDGFYEKVLPFLSGILKIGGKVICEHPADIKLLSCYDGLDFLKEYSFGTVKVTVFIKS